MSSVFRHFLIVSMASQSEITRKMENSSLNNHAGSPGFLSRSEISHGEHPLSLGKSSIWNQFFQVLLSIAVYSMYCRYGIISFISTNLYLAHLVFKPLKLVIDPAYPSSVYLEYSIWLQALPLTITPIFVTFRTLRLWNRLTEMSCALIQTYTSSQGTQLLLSPTKSA